MKSKAQKTSKNIALKVAIVRRDLTQREVAARTGIPEIHLSLIVRGHVQATDDEQIALAKVLRHKRSELFPSPQQAIAS